MPNGEFKMKSVGAMASINDIASSFKIGNSVMMPAFRSSTDREEVINPPFQKWINKNQSKNTTEMIHSTFCGLHISIDSERIVCLHQSNEW